MCNMMEGNSKYTRTLVWTTTHLVIPAVPIKQVPSITLCHVNSHNPHERVKYRISFCVYRRAVTYVCHTYLFRDYGTIFGKHRFAQISLNPEYVRVYVLVCMYLHFHPE